MTYYEFGKENEKVIMLTYIKKVLQLVIGAAFVAGIVILHSVKPICHEKFPVFIQNSREYKDLINL
ncbi:hypothetical protein [Butyrivibrio sp. FCS006]|uniref:hypothetical protein n=1 Tax=Butyrivibrio sp. FCS006 TaxID=1280684 RepID=UPI00047C99A3|nr:hypothetical protein [Butyrivibrio sp. FCS006]